MIRVLFRADASREIGGGHVMRCRVLADALAARGAVCGFVTAPETLATVPALGQGPHAVHLLPQEAWPPAEVVVFDHYGVDPAEGAALAAAGRRVVWIDDVPGRVLPCDLVLNQNAGIAAADYDGLVPAGARRLIGPRHALLRPEFAGMRAGEGPPHRVFVSFGLTDYGGLAQPAMRAVQSLGLPCDVAVGAAAPGLARLRDDAGPGTRLHVDPPEVAALMARATLAVGAAGSMSWERCALGLPSVAVAVADNQARIAAALAETGAARVLPRAAGEAAFAREIAALLARPGELRAMATAARALCDGRGAERVADAVLALAG